jgi:hypothetical protein
VILLVAILIVVLLGAVIALVSAPLRAARRPASPHAEEAQAGSGGAPARALALERDELESAREAKYREIRDAELDYRTGKLSQRDFEAIDAELRAEAIAILDRIDRLQQRSHFRSDAEPAEPANPDAEPANPPNPDAEPANPDAPANPRDAPASPAGPDSNAEVEDEGGPIDPMTSAE